MSKRTLSACILCVTDLLFAAVPSGRLFAQSSTGSISGNVVDASGAGVPGASVSARNVDTGATRAATSGASGGFALPNLTPGNYALSAELSGFSPAKVTSVTVTVGGDATVKLVLEVGGVEAKVTVSGEAPLIEATKSEVSSVVNERAIQNLPANGRNFIDFVLTTPGVVKDNFRVGDIVFAGQRGTLNSLVVDGGDNNNTFFGQALGRTGTGRAPYQFSEDAVKEFQVNSSAYSAEYGRAGGAVINVVTKSGTNDYHGSAFYYYRDKSLNAKDYTDASAKPPKAKAAYHFDQFGATLGGPFLRDRVFFFANYDGQRNQTPNSVLFPPSGFVLPPDADSQAGFAKLQALAASWNRKQDQDVYLLKLDAEVGAANHASVRYNRQNFTGVGFESGGSNVSFEHSGDSLVKTDTLAGSFTSSFTPSLFNELKGQYAKDKEPGTANSSNPEANVQNLLLIGENFFSPRETTIKRYQIGDTATFLFGNHTLKGGFDYLHDDILNFFPGNFFGSYTFASLASFNRGAPSGAGERYVQAFAGPGSTGPTTEPNVRDVAGFLQDEWRMLPGLTFNLGVRYDRQQIAQPTVLNTDAQLLAAGLRTDVIPEDKNNWGARLGFAWSPRASDRTLVKGGYGIFYGRTPAIMIGTAHSNNGINVQTLTFTGSTVPTYPNRFATPPTGGAAAVPTILLFDPRFQNPKVQQASVGVEQVLTNDIAVAVNYLHVKGEDLPRSTDVNIGEPSTVTVPIQQSGGTTIPSASFKRFSSTKPFSNFARIIEFQSTAESEYNGVTVELNKRFSSNWQAKVAYTLGKVTDTKPDATAVVPQGSDDAKFASDPSDFQVDSAPGDNDVRHRIVLSGVWNVDYGSSAQNPVVRFLTSGWTLSGIVSFQTGMPYSLEINGDLNNDGNTRNDLVPGTVRNSHRLPSLFSVDPRIAKHITVGPVDVELIAEAFNVFNAKNVVGLQSIQYRVVTVAGQPQLAAPTTVFLSPCAGGQGCTAQAPLTASTGPRILQLAAKVSF